MYFHTYADGGQLIVVIKPTALGHLNKNRQFTQQFT